MGRLKGRLAHQDGYWPGHDSRLFRPVYDIPPSDYMGVRLGFPCSHPLRRAAGPTPRRGARFGCSLALCSPPGARPDPPRGGVSQERAALTIATMPALRASGSLGARVDHGSRRTGHSGEPGEAG